MQRHAERRGVLRRALGDRSPAWRHREADVDVEGDVIGVAAQRRAGIEADVGFRLHQGVGAEALVGQGIGHDSEEVVRQAVPTGLFATAGPTCMQGEAAAHIEYAVCVHRLGPLCAGCGGDAGAALQAAQTAAAASEAKASGPVSSGVRSTAVARQGPSNAFQPAH